MAAPITTYDEGLRGRRRLTVSASSVATSATAAT